jgi:hypothetical protein
LVRAGVWALVLALGPGAASAAADAASLYRGPAPRPGPDILYSRAARAPQLTNAGIWRAAPILISGASSYRNGEFVYQDFLYDDRGARSAQSDPADPRAGDLFSRTAGSYTYPTAPAYAGNAADLVELRVRPTSRSTAFRITLNTMVDPEVAAATIAIGTSPAPRPFPHGANVSAPAELFLTVHGGRATLIDAASGRALAAPSARVDSRRRQLQAVVPRSVWDPARSRIRLAAGVGLWDKGAGQYLVPGARADATHPGGAGSLTRPAAFFNVAFRHTEPLPKLDPTILTSPEWWRDLEQSDALTGGDISRFSATVDFRKLRSGRRDDMTGRAGGVPRYGAMNRILASHTESKQGVDYSQSCKRGRACEGQFLGRLQPYSIYVPRPRPRRRRLGLTLLLHSLTANYNQFSGTRNQSQFANRAGGRSIVITPEARGPGGFYEDMAGADVFEVWADVARRYRLNPRLTATAGYSMGGFGTYKFAAQYPDLFAAAQPTVGALSIPARQLASARWVPFLSWNATADELVPQPLYRVATQRLDALGYRYELDQYAPVAPAPPIPTPQHISLAGGDQYAPAARFLSRKLVSRNPPRVTFVANPENDYPNRGTAADHAYWLSRIRTRSTGLGEIDVRSEGLGLGDPTPSATKTGVGVLIGGALGPRPFARTSKTWSKAPRTGRRNRLTIKAENIARVTIHAARAGVGCNARLTVESDGPIAVRLTGCAGKGRARTRTFG